MAWAALSESAQRIADELLERTPAVHAKDAVTAILADFRGLDTLELITAVLFDVGVFLLVFGVVVGVLRFIAEPGEET